MQMLRQTSLSTKRSQNVLSILIWFFHQVMVFMLPVACVIQLLVICLFSFAYPVHKWCNSLKTCPNPMFTYTFHILALSSGLRHPGALSDLDLLCHGFIIFLLMFFYCGIYKKKIKWALTQGSLLTSLFVIQNNCGWRSPAYSHQQLKRETSDGHYRMHILVGRSFFRWYFWGCLGGGGMAL